MKINTLIRYSGNMYQLCWIFILWTPFVFTLYNTGSIVKLYNQLTWWSWSIQCLFYTYMHFKISILYKSIRQKFNICKNKKLKEIEMYIFGIVSGITWFVFFEFMYVLYHNPSIVYNESLIYANKGIPQIGNIFIHYYIVAATPMWTIFNFRYLHKQLKDFTNKQALLFSTLWIVYLFAYVCYWKFDINGIFQNYHIDDVSFFQNCIYIIGLFFVVTNANAIYLYCIKDKLYYD